MKGKAVYLKSRLKTKKGEAKEPNLDEPPPPFLSSSCDKAFVILPTTAVLCQNIEFAK